MVLELGVLGPTLSIGHPCGAAGDREGPAALSCRVPYVFLFPISFCSIGGVLVWLVGRDSQVPGPDWTCRPRIGAAGPFDHLVKGEREEAVRVWYGNAEQ